MPPFSPSTRASAASSQRHPGTNGQDELAIAHVIGANARTFDGSGYVDTRVIFIGCQPVVTGTHNDGAVHFDVNGAVALSQNELQIEHESKGTRKRLSWAVAVRANAEPDEGSWPVHPSAFLNRMLRVDFVHQPDWEQ